MNKKTPNFITNFSYSLGANIITLLVSVVIIAVVSKLLGVVEYGYFQLYIFYTSYILFFHFGLPNGIYLRYGGKEYNSLNKGLFVFQFWMMSLFDLVLAVTGCIIIVFNFGVHDKGFILLMTCICGIIIIPRDFLLLTLLATNRIKDYGKATIIDRFVYIASVIFLLAIGVREYSLLILADLFGKLVATTWIIYLCKDIVFGQLPFWGQGAIEALKNLSAGVKLMLSNIADMLIIGVVQMGMEYKWDIETFGKVSLTISLSSLLMVFVNAISVVMFPMLRRSSHTKMLKTYSILHNILIVPLLGLMMVYYPMKQLLSLWLPQYAESFTYIALLFPICVYQSKISMLVNTYLKNLRKEKWILIVNLVSVLISIITSAITIFLLNNLTLTIVSIVFIIAFRCIFAEILLSKYIDIKVKKDIILEIVMCIIFMCTGWFIRSYLSVLLYGICYMIYLVIKSKDMVSTILWIKILLKYK